MTFLTVPFFTYIFAVIPVWLPLLAVDLVALYMLIFKERMDPRSLVFWVSIVFILPFLGFALYLGWGSTILMDYQGRRKSKRDEESLKCECDPVPEIESDVVKSIACAGGDPFIGGNRGKILSEIHSGLEEYLSTVNSAARSIHIETERLPRGEAGRRMVEHLCRKAREGVDVKIILGKIGFGRSKGKRALKRSGVSIRTFHSAPYSAFFIKAANRYQRELHIIDGESIFLGKHPLMIIRGKAGNRAEKMFAADWRASGGRGYDIPENAEDTNGFGTQLVRSGPDAPMGPMMHGYAKIMSSAKERITIAMPYMIPGDEMYNSIRQAALASKDVRVYIPLKGRHWYQYWNSLASSAALVEAGVRVFFSKEAEPSNLMVADGRICAIGSMVINTRSPLSDYGLSVVSYSKELSEQAESYLSRLAEDAFECTREMTRSFPDRLRIAAARLVMFLN